jgi:hypothetical protein
LELFLLLFSKILPPVRALYVEFFNPCFVVILCPTGLRKDVIHSLLPPPSTSPRCFLSTSGVKNLDFLSAFSVEKCLSSTSGVENLGRNSPIVKHYT